MGPRLPILLPLAGLLLAACGSTSSSSASLPTAPPTTVLSEPTTSLAPENPPAVAIDSIRLCDQVPEIRSDGVEGEFLTSGERFETMLAIIGTYTGEHADTFAGQWIDRTANTFVVAFTDDPANHRDDLLATTLSPDGDDPLGNWGVAIDVVQAPFSEADLVDRMVVLNDELRAAGIELSGTSAAVTRGVVGLSIIEPTEQTLIDLQPLVDPADVCVEGSLVDPNRDRPEPGDELNVIVSADPTDIESIDPTTLVDCNGERFEVGSLLEQVSVADSEVDGLADALEAFMSTDDAAFVAGEGSSTDAADWLFLGFDGTGASVLFDTGDAVTTMGFNREGDTWMWGGSAPNGGCDITTTLPDGLGVVTWEVDPTQPPTPESTSVTVLATERTCSGSREMGDQLLGPQVVETDAAVLIAFAAIPPRGDQTCPGNPATPVTIELSAPLGDRELRDGLSVSADIRTFLD